MMKTRITPLIILLFATLAGAAPVEKLREVRRIVFLGDSITQGGDYITDIECWLLAQGVDVEVVNLGLGSETATDLTAEENEGHLRQHGFGRPPVSERLARAVAATKPDFVFACYGMNDGSGLPGNARGTERFAAAVTELRRAAFAAGAKHVVLCTPPVNDRSPEGEANLVRYTAWLRTQQGGGWDVVDLHTPMRVALDEQRRREPEFKFAKDGIHPGREGHWLMARGILVHAFGAKLDGVTSAEQLFPARGAKIRALVHQRMRLRFEAWMTAIGHQRPGVAGGPKGKPGLPLPEAEAKSADLTRQIKELIGPAAPGAPADSKAPARS